MRFHLRHVERRIGVIAADQVNRFPIGRQPQRMRTMLADRTVKIAELDDFVELIVPLRIAQTVQCAARTAVHRHVQTIEGVEQSLSRADFRVEVFDLRLAIAPSPSGRGPG